MATTAAVLDILIKANTTQANAALMKTQGHLKATDKQGGRAMGGLVKGAKFAGVGMAAGLGIAAVGIKKASDAFYASQRISKQTDAVIKSTGGAAKVSAKHVGDLATAISKKTGIDDEAIQSGENLLLTFKNIRNETGKGNKIFDQATRSVTDMSAALGQDTKSSAIQLGKALNDPVKGITALQRVGVSFTESQKNQIKGLVEHGDKLKAQKLILHELNAEFGGSAAAQATNMDKLKVTMGNLQESVGSVFVPLVEKASGALNKLVDGMMSGTGAGGRLIGILKDAGQVISAGFSAAIGFASKLLREHRDDLQNVTGAVRNVGKAVVFVWQQVVWPVVKRVLPAIVQVIRGAFNVIGGIVKVISSLLTGRFGDAWDGVKQIFRGAIGILLGYLRAATAPFRELASRVGKALSGPFGDAWDAVKAGFRSLRTWLGERLDDFKNLAHDVAKPFVDAFKRIAGVVKKLIGYLEDVVGLVKDIIEFIGNIKVPDINLPDLNPLHIGGKGNGSTVGPIGKINNVQDIADLSLKYGLSGGRGVDQAFRPGDDGWHGQNRARDLSGPAGIMLAFAKALATSPVAARLLELIHTPLGFGIKNGQFVPNSFWGAEVLADHYDHVHVAMRRGGKVPGMGAGDRVPALLEPGEFVIRKQIVDKFGPTFFANVNRMRDGGIVQAAKAAKAAGFRGNNLLTAIAIAGPESGFRNSARLRTSAEDSRGMTQINTYAHPWARKLNLYNAFVNYRAARRVWREAGGSFSPWSGFTSGGYRAYMDDARRAVASLKKKGGGGGKGKGKHGGGLGVKFGPLIPDPPPRPPAGTLEPGPDSGGGGPSGGDNGAAQLAAIMAEVAANQRKLIYLQETQAPSMVGMVLQAVNDGLGSPVGLSLQGTRSRVGSVAGF